MRSTIAFVSWIVAAASAVLIGHVIAEEAKPSTVLFSESFDDADLLKRGWHDGSRFKIVSDGAFPGKGCIDYRWKEKATNPHTISGVRHPIKATDRL